MNGLNRINYRHNELTGKIMQCCIGCFWSGVYLKKRAEAMIKFKKTEEKPYPDIEYPKQCNGCGYDGKFVKYQFEYYS